MNAKQRLFKVVSAEDILGRLSLRKLLGLCSEVLTDDELEELFRTEQITLQYDVKSPQDFPEPDIIVDDEPEPEPEPAPVQTVSKRKPRVKDESTSGLMLAQEGEFRLKTIVDATGRAMSHIAVIAQELMARGLLTRRQDPNCRRVSYLYKVVSTKSTDTRQTETPEPEPKPEPKKPRGNPFFQLQKKEDPKKPKAIGWKDLYDRPEVIECIYKDLYIRMHKCLENMGMHDLKELLQKNFPELKQLFDLGVNDVNLMVAGRDLLDYLTNVNTTGKARKYDCTVIMKDNKGTYKARPSEMTRYAKAKGWGSNE